MKAPTYISNETIAFLLVTGLCSGMSIIICVFVLLTEGPSFRLTGDRDRQRFLAFVCTLTAIWGCLGNGFKEGVDGKSVEQSIMSFFFNFGVQVGLVVIVHNSIIRGLTALSTNIETEFLKKISRLCCLFYLLILPVMSPTFISLVNPKESNVTSVSRYMNIVFVIVIEVIASTSDILLLRRMTKNWTDGKEIQGRMMKDMWTVYIVIWLTICADIGAKLTRNFTRLLIADLAITNLTNSLRAIANIRYGTTLKSSRAIYRAYMSTQQNISTTNVQQHTKFRKSGCTSTGVRVETITLEQATSDNKVYKTPSNQSLRQEKKHILRKWLEHLYLLGKPVLN